jgi:agarase
MYRQYVESVENLPAFVGCHWFRYSDEPLTGRIGDGENYNIGFVSVTDTPYPELVKAAKAVNAEVYRYRSRE